MYWTRGSSLVDRPHAAGYQRDLGARPQSRQQGAGQEQRRPRTDPHTHPWDESFYVIRGEVDFSVNCSDLRSARPGDLVHVPAGTPHWFR